ncbi:hypothetical protein KSP40_PGU000267 [Platanthera guangdongensis]|uniref:UDENN domain-containing protein n=1 Tax=Platanthera guangdongensis TaxID=2320717 RepID=A0ABR2MXZ6_9ASPA
MPSRLFEYFVVCGIGPEIQTLDGGKGFKGPGIMYMPSLLEQFPPSNPLYLPPPPQLPTCVLPAGVEFHPSGFDPKDVFTYPIKYPIVLTEGDGSKIYVSCIAFRDLVCEDIALSYRIQTNYFADKCICLVSRSPIFQVLQDALEELFILCFSLNSTSMPLWEVIAHMVSNVPLPKPGKERILFAIENRLLSVEAPPKEGLPHADISFQPLVQCLDVDNLIRLFTAVLLERRILLRSNKYALLTLVSEAICLLVYPFRWQHVYIPLLFFTGAVYIEAPTPYMMGLHSTVDTSGLTLEGVVVVDLDCNSITCSEDLPPIPEPESTFLRSEILKLLQPNVVGIDYIKINLRGMSDHYAKASNRTWGEVHDFQLRLIFLKFFALLLSGYRNFIENSANNIFNSQAFMKKRSRSTNQTVESMVMIAQFLDSQGFLDYLERYINSDEIGHNLLDKLQDATGRGQDPMTIFPSVVEPEIITISSLENRAAGEKCHYDRFPARIRNEEQEEKRKLILAVATGALDYSAEQFASSPSMLRVVDSNEDALSPRERAAERDRMVLDIQVKLQLKTAINRATFRSDMITVIDALEVSAEMYRRDPNGVPDYIQRYLLSISIWEDLRFWESYFEHLMEHSSNKMTNYVTLVTAQLVIMTTHMAGLGLPDGESWNIIESISEKNNLGYKQLIKLRGFLSYIQQLRVGYWGLSAWKSYAPSFGLPSPRSQDASVENQPQDEASGVGRSWVQSMFSRDRSIRANSFARVHKWASDTDASELPASKQKKIQSSARMLRGHSGSITALHCVTRREVWDLVGDREDAGFLISGSTDCTVKIWDPTLRGSELRETLKGHTRPIRAINSDRCKVVSGSDDQSVIVWDKQTCQLLEELKGHASSVSCVRMLSGERVLTAAHDGAVKMWDVRTDTCVATVGRCSSAVLCMEYDDSTGILAAAGRDIATNVWDIRAGRQMQKLLGHTKWIRSITMVGDIILTGSDDWTARLWSVSRGTCDAVLACHSGSILCVEYSPSDKGIITGSADGLVKIWENEEGSTVHIFDAQLISCFRSTFYSFFFYFP